MKRLLLILTLAGCSDPRLAAGIVIGADGVRVAPTLSGRVGGATVSVTP
jgi:hypothetical protein